MAYGIKYMAEQQGFEALPYIILIKKFSLSVGKKAIIIEGTDIQGET